MNLPAMAERKITSEWMKIIVHACNLIPDMYYFYVLNFWYLTGVFTSSIYILYTHKIIPELYLTSASSSLSTMRLYQADLGLSLPPPPPPHPCELKWVVDKYKSSTKGARAASHPGGTVCVFFQWNRRARRRLLCVTSISMKSTRD